MDILVVVIKVIPQERVSMRIVAQIVDLPAPQIMKESIEVARSIPRDCVQRTAEQGVMHSYLRLKSGCKSAK